jgi:putative oxidoreductase
MGPFVGVVELVCGALIIAGLFTRLATIPLIVTMIVALIATKLPILLGTGLARSSLPDFKRYSFWSAQHESRADLTMLLGYLYLSITGSGRWSIDRLLVKDAADDQQADGRRAETY